MWLFAAHPVLLQAFGVTIFAHGFFFALAAEVSVLHMQYMARKKGLKSEVVPLYGFIIFVVGLAAARIGFFISYPTAFTSFGDLLSIWHGGLVSYWGLIAGLLVAYFLFKRETGSLLTWIDLTCLSGLLGWAIGRLGNYYASDSVGVRSTHFEQFYGRVPIQLLESFWCLLLCVVLSRYWNNRKPGSLAFLGLGLYFTGRIVIDAWRDEGHILSHIHTSQAISGILLGLTLVSYWRFRNIHA